MMQILGGHHKYDQAGFFLAWIQSDLFTSETFLRKGTLGCKQIPIRLQYFYNII